MVSVTSTSRYVTSASRYQSRSSMYMYIRGLLPRNWPRQFRLVSLPRGAMGWSVECDCVISWPSAFALYIFFRNLTCHWFLYIKDYVEAVVEVKVLVLDLENSTDCQKDKLSVSKGRHYIRGLYARKLRPGQTCTSLHSYRV